MKQDIKYWAEAVKELESAFEKEHGMQPTFQKCDSHRAILAATAHATTMLEVWYTWLQCLT